MLSGETIQADLTCVAVAPVVARRHEKYRWRWTDELDAELRQLVAECYPWRAIKDRMQISEEALKRRARELGLTKPDTRTKAYRKARLLLPTATPPKPRKPRQPTVTCRRGHLRNHENTYYSANGNKECRLCSVLRTRRRSERIKRLLADVW